MARTLRTLRRAAALSLAAALAVMGLADFYRPTYIHAAPIVEVKSHSRLQLESVERDGEQVVVRGRLYDPSTSLGLADAELEIRVAGVTARAHTDADGRFVVYAMAPPGQQAIEMRFPGNDSLDEAELSELADPALQPVILTFEAQPTATGVRLLVQATTASATAFRPTVTLFADSAASDEMKELTKLTAGNPVEVTRKQLGGAGTRRFRADFAGDDSHQPASVVGLYELTSASKTTLVVDDRAVAYEDTIEVTGQITDEDGVGMGGAAVTLVASSSGPTEPTPGAPGAPRVSGAPTKRAPVSDAASGSTGDRRLAQGVAGPDGRYRFSIEGEILGSGQHSLQALAEPGGSIQSSRSEPVVMRVALPQPVPITYTVIAFLATGLAAGAFFAARNKPWKRFAKEPTPAQQVVQNAEAQRGGLVAAKPSLVSTLRRASDVGFSGAVRDTVRGRPVAGAMVVLRRHGDAAMAQAAAHVAMPTTPPRSPFAPPGSEASPTMIDGVEHRALAGDDGGFEFEELPAGDWLVSVSALSHITETFPISLPHRGELRGVRVDLVPVREKVFLLYQRAAMPVLPDPKLWGVWSPRQVVDHVRRSRPSPALAKLTDFVEEVYFSARPIEETVLPAARQRVDAAIAERAEPPMA